MEKYAAVIQFLFIVAVPIAAALGGLVALFAVGALFDFLDNQEQAARRIEALFRRPPKTPTTVGPEHYYRPYWVK
jgi:hypothetical protein